MFKFVKNWIIEIGLVLMIVFTVSFVIYNVNKLNNLEEQVRQQIKGKGNIIIMHNYFTGFHKYTSGTIDFNNISIETLKEIAKGNFKTSKDQF